MRDQWVTVDRYLSDLFVPPDSSLEGALRAVTEAGMPAISVAPTQGALLHILAYAAGARRILEIGTLGGYSTIWLARALPAGGRLITLEAEPRHAEVAQASLARAGLADLVELRLGPAHESLPQLAAEGAEPFDLIFIDADKPNYPGYFAWAVQLARPGGLIIADNVVRDGAVADSSSADPRVQGVRQMLEAMAREPRVRATVLQTVGAKGYDGLAIAVVV
jgi:predicted O-methyltransferase YrrM